MTISLPVTDYERIREAAYLGRVSISQLVREAVRDVINRTAGNQPPVGVE